MCVYRVCLTAKKQFMSVKFKNWQQKAVERRAAEDSMILELCFKLTGIGFQYFVIKFISVFCLFFLNFASTGTASLEDEEESEEAE